MVLLSTSTLLKLMKEGRIVLLEAEDGLGKQKDTNMLAVDGCVTDWAFSGHWTELHQII